MKIRTGLFYLAAAAIVPVLLLALALGMLLIDHERETFRRGAVDRNRAFMSAVEAAIDGHVATLKALSTSANLDRGDTAAFAGRLERILVSQPDWLDVTLSLPNGERVVSARYGDAGVRAPIVDLASIERSAAMRQPIVGNVVRREPSGRHGIGIRYPVVVRGEVVYVLSAILDPAIFQRLIEAQQLPQGWVSGLVDTSRHFVARVPFRSHDDLASIDFRTRTDGIEEGWYRGRTVEGHDSFTAFRTSPRLGWSIGLGVPSDVVTASSRRAMWTIGVGVVIALVVALSIAVVIGQRIAAPVAALAVAARSVGRGDKPVRPATPSGVEELRDVERALEESAEAIAERATLREREQSALREADRAKDEFIAMLGHELRNPLSAITNSVHLLRLAPGGAAEARARDVIDRQAKQMTRLVEDLLDISRLSTGKLVLHREPVDLAEVVRHLVETWRETGRLEPDRVRLDVAPAVVSADRSRLEQVIANLLDNANKFSPPGTAIEVAVRENRGDALLSVADKGEGIDPALLDAVFRPFVQGPQDMHRPSGGLGLGLAVVHRIVELHGGMVTAASGGQGRGATFEVRLPLAREAANADDPDAALRA